MFSSPTKTVNPFAKQVMSVQSKGFVPSSHAPLSPIKANIPNHHLSSFQNSPDRNISTFMPLNQTPSKSTCASSQTATPGLEFSGKSFVERSMYKRDMCKNWTEAGFCRYGSKCQYAHG